jgi:hypothetical protein
MKEGFNGKQLETDKPVQIDGHWCCGLCGKPSISRAGIYKHYNDNHGGGKSLFTTNKVNKSRKLVQRDCRVKARAKNAPRYNLRMSVRVGKERASYLETADDHKVHIHGGYNTPHSALQVRKSKQPGGGGGVFTKESFIKGDLLTTYVGIRSPVNLGGVYSLVLLDGLGFIQGKARLKTGDGLGSKINRTNSGQHANVEFLQRVKRNKDVIVEVVATSAIPAGAELLAHYGHTCPRV